MINREENSVPTGPAPRQQPPPPQQPRRKTGCLRRIALVFGLTMFCLFLIAVFRIGSLISSQTAEPERGVDEYPDLSTTWSYGEGDTTVVRIPIVGTIMRDHGEGGLFASVDSVEQALRRIQTATKDETVCGIILEIDSPGGGITASDVIYKALMDFKTAQAGRKIVALLGDVAASGGYYVASAADCIIAHPTTVTGSIGVLISTVNFRQLGEKLGVSDVTIKSGKNKDLLNPLAEVTPEQRALLQEVIDRMYERFIAVVLEGRQGRIEEPQLRRLADGSVFVADKALEYGLIDQIGYWEDAARKTGELLGVEQVKVMKYERTFRLSDLFRGRSRLVRFPESFLSPRCPRVLYLWRP